MKKAILFLSFAALMTAGFTSCGKKAATEATTTKAVYVCPMPEDSDIVADAPGACPKCGMDLIEKK